MLPLFFTGYGRGFFLLTFSMPFFLVNGQSIHPIPKLISLLHSLFARAILDIVYLIYLI